jgi:hypothetical protein
MILLVLLIIVGLIGLGLLAAGAFIVLRDSRQETHRLVRIVLLILGLLLVTYASVSIFSYFWILH